MQDAPITPDRSLLGRGKGEIASVSRNVFLHNNNNNNLQIIDKQNKQETKEINSKP